MEPNVFTTIKIPILRQFVSQGHSNSIFFNINVTRNAQSVTGPQ